MGFSVFDNYQIRKKWLNLKENWVENGFPSLFFATLDIKKCYDSIDIDLLLSWLSKTPLLQDFYVTFKYEAFYRNKHPNTKGKAFRELFNAKTRWNSVSAEDLNDPPSLFSEHNVDFCIVVPYEGVKAVTYHH